MTISIIAVSSQPIAFADLFGTFRNKSSSKAKRDKVALQRLQVGAAKPADFLKQRLDPCSHDEMRPSTDRTTNAVLIGLRECLN